MSSSTLLSLMSFAFGAPAASGLGSGKARCGMLCRALQVGAAVGGRSRALGTAGRVLGEPAAAASGRFAKPSDVRFAHLPSGWRSWIGSAASTAIGSAGCESSGVKRRKPSVSSAEMTA